MESKKSKLYLNEFDIFNFLIANSSENCPVSINDISVFFSKCIDYAGEDEYDDFHKLSCEEINKITRTISYDKYNIGDINESVRTYVKRTLSKYLNKEILTGFIVKSKEKVESFNSSVKIYYIKLPLSETQISLLRDAISVFPYAEPNKTEEIINALNILTPVYNREKYLPKVVNADKYRGSYHRNLKEIKKAFSSIKKGKMSGKIKKLKFTYCKYDSNKELIPAIHDGKATRIVDPVKILWSNGFYYLVTFYVKDGKARYINFRIDRMKNVRCLEEDAIPIEGYLPRISRMALETKQNIKRLGDSFRGDKKLIDASERIDDNGFSVAGYKSTHPVMYTGNELPVIKIKCNICLMNNAIDTFGFDFETTQTENPDEVIITLRDTDSHGVTMWALEYGSNCEILEPPELRESIKEIVMNMSEKYQKSL